eukprot:gene5175-5413_t
MQVTGYFPGQAPKHAAVYTGLLFNDDARQGKLQTWESFMPKSDQLAFDRGVEPNIFGATAETDFCVEDTSPQRVVKIAGTGSNLLFEGAVDEAKLTIHSLAGSQPWSEGGGSPQGLLHLIPGIGLHWYVHSTATPVEYKFQVASAGSGSSGSACNTPRVLQGRGIAHIEKNWGGSFPRSFLWSQGFATGNSVTALKACNGSSSNGDGNKPGNEYGNGNGNGNEDGNGNGNGTENGNGNGNGLDNNSSRRSTGGPTEFETQASFCLAGGVLPTFNVDKLPLPLPDMLLLGYRSQHRTWHFKPQSPAIFSNTVKPEQGLLIVKAQQLTRTLVLKIEAGLETFSRVAGPTRGGFVPHSVESYSAKATAECYEYGQLVEVTHFDRTGLEFGGSYACSLEQAAGRSCEGLCCEPQHEQ